ncbi:Transforming growth factor-beta-induced protein ig-h3 [Echinococcus granulosus]|uniref:Transforming growth factor-beta-induced protein ig-h3 n=1 Tax=Echinococcus granulosus TaxID=6210 RepID=W6UFP8_ECHGR|nr:Transforming growth factor-beta-induced protein ig-h3 [Echinococcus granulosus]EUB59736.1 Transforming growth factor-beta-induced protein ig-h3 [Echinococcus granulosus]
MGVALLVLAYICLSTVTAIRFEQNPSPPQYAKPDQYGYRMCASWLLADGTPIYSGCDPFKTKRCGKELEFDYRCCSGFQHSNEPLGGPSSNPCGKLIPQFDDCPSVIEELGFRKFASYLKNYPELTQRSGQPYTIFVPLPEDGGDLDRIYGGNTRTVSYHVAKGRHYADDLRTGVKLKSIYNDEDIEISRTTYGAKISQADIECKSGLIHIIRRPLVPRSGLGNLNKNSVMSLLQSNPETFEFANALPQELQQDLSRVEGGHFYTVTAPTSDSWSSLRGRYNREQLEAIAASHVSKGLKCTSNIIKGQQTFTDMQGQLMKVECSVNPSNRQEIRKITDACGDTHEFVDRQADLMAANGVVHVIRSPVIPMSQLTLKDLMDRPECAKYQNIDKFIDVLRECDLYMDDASQYAVIAPENSAFDWWSGYAQFRPEYQRFQVDKEYRCEVARYHIVKHNGNLANIQDFSGHTDGHRSNNRNNYLYETTYFTKGKMGSTLNWHYSPVNNLQPLKLKNTSIYKTSRINVMPEKNITNILEERKDFSHTNSITKIAEMEEYVFKKKAPKNLYLVTTDEGWIDPRSRQLSKKLVSPELARYEGHATLAENFAKLNHVPLYLWGGDIGYFEKNSVHRFMSSAGVELIFWMDDKGTMRIGYDELPKSEWPKVVEYNLPGRDGIVWALDGFLRCPNKLCALQLEDKDTYTFYTAACLTSDLEGEVDVKRAFSSKPTEIAKRHPTQCLVIKQGEVTTVKDIFEDNMSEPSNAKYDDETARLSAAGLLTARRRIACPPCPQGLALHRSQGGRALYPSIPSMSHFPVAYQMVSPYVMFGGYCAAACSFSLSSLSTPSAPFPSTLLYTTKQPSETIAIVLKNIELENGKCGLQRCD